MVYYMLARYYIFVFMSKKNTKLRISVYMAKLILKYFLLNSFFSNETKFSIITTSKIGEQNKKERKREYYENLIHF
jgi:hypothetical protein